MIAGDTAWLEEYRAQLPERLYKCLEKVKAFDFAHTEDGKYNIEGCGTLSIESPSTEPAVMRRMEGHKKYIDVVYLIDGEEWIGYLPHHDARGRRKPFRNGICISLKGRMSRGFICCPDGLPSFSRRICTGRSVREASASAASARPS